MIYHLPKPIGSNFLLLFLLLQVVFQSHTINIWIVQNQNSKCKYCNAVYCADVSCAAQDTAFKPPDQVRTSRFLCEYSVSCTRGIACCCLIFTGVCQPHRHSFAAWSVKSISIQNCSLQQYLQLKHTQQSKTTRLYTYPTQMCRRT